MNSVYEKPSSPSDADLVAFCAAQEARSVVTRLIALVKQKLQLAKKPAPVVCIFVPRSMSQ